VTCTTKHSTYERITHVGCVSDTGLYHRFTEEEVLQRIANGDEFHVTRPEGHTVKIIPAERHNHPYVKTEPDGERPDNLLSLPHCVEKPKDNRVVPPTRVVPAGSHSVQM
jgi:antitoxin (DNA-binding transcriptional repressor) of toxin-antitoxin stability system